MVGSQKWCFGQIRKGEQKNARIFPQKCWMTSNGDGGMETWAPRIPDVGRATVATGWWRRHILGSRFRISEARTLVRVHHILYPQYKYLLTLHC